LLACLLACAYAYDYLFFFKKIDKLCGWGVQLLFYERKNYGCLDVCFLAVSTTLIEMQIAL
jgi:hypothetical protein